MQRGGRRGGRSKVPNNIFANAICAYYIKIIVEQVAAEVVRASWYDKVIFIVFNIKCFLMRTFNSILLKNIYLVPKMAFLSL